VATIPVPFAACVTLPILVTPSAYDKETTPNALLDASKVSASRIFLILTAVAVTSASAASTGTSNKRPSTTTI